MPYFNNPANQGNGVLINKKGYILINNNLTTGQKVLVTDFRQTNFHTEVAFKNDSLNLAILKIIDSQFNFKEKFTLAIRRIKYQLGEEVFVLSKSINNQYSFSKGYINSLDNDSNIMKIDFISFPEIATTPIFDVYGSLIGFTNFKENNLVRAEFSLTVIPIFNILNNFNINYNNTAFENNFSILNVSMQKKLVTNELISQIKPYILSYKIQSNQ